MLCLHAGLRQDPKLIRSDSTILAPVNPCRVLLLREYLVSAYECIKAERLGYLRYNRDRIWADLYSCVQPPVSMKKTHGALGCEKDIFSSISPRTSWTHATAYRPLGGNFQ